jgi:putative hemolysin
MAHLNRIPRVGDTMNIGEFILEVIDMDGRRIDKVLIQRDPTAGSNHMEIGGPA